MDTKRCLSFPLRLSPDESSQLRELARQEGISLNQLIETAVAEKVARTECEFLLMAQQGMMTSQLPNPRVQMYNQLKAAGVERQPLTPVRHPSAIGHVGR